MRERTDIQRVEVAVGSRERTSSRFGLIVEVADAAARRVDTAPAAVMEAITQVSLLPEWNAAIESVAEDPGTLDVGSEWVVVMQPRGWPRWRSRSTVDELDHEAGRFSYTTQTDDGNPSSATWTWQISPAETGSEIAVAWHLHPKTVGRRTVIGRLRRAMLVREVNASLRRLDALLDRRGSG